MTNVTFCMYVWDNGIATQWKRRVEMLALPSVNKFVNVLVTREEDGIVKYFRPVQVNKIEWNVDGTVSIDLAPCHAESAENFYEALDRAGWTK